MQFNEETPRKSITIQGVDLSVPAPFEEGHACSANEASALNQLLSENLRNNMAAKVKQLQESDADVDAIQAALDEYAGTYEFGVRRGGGGRTADPVMAAAMEIARSKVKDAIRAKGMSIKDVGAEKITELAKQAIEANPEIKERAEQIVAMHNEVVSELELNI